MANNLPLSGKTATIQRAWVARATNAFAMKLALMLTAAGNARDAYSASNECTATGYSAGGVAVASITAANGSAKGLMDAADTSFGTLTGPFQYGDFYDDGNSPKQVLMTLDFGSQNPNGVTVTVQWPVADDSNSMYRIS